MLQSVLPSPVVPIRPELLANSLVAADLDRVDDLYQHSLAPFRKQFGTTMERLRQYRGKRLRPLLLLMTAKACGKITHAHHLLGAVVEMIHTATLVHDDVLDEAETRRHVRTINADHDNKFSILLGDLLFTNAFHLTSTLGDAEACRWIGEATNAVCAGELRQISERGNLQLREEDYFAIIEGKTAALTECCCRLGAIYAGADAEVVEQLATYGRHLGIAFQIADDLLDLIGKEGTAGKTLGTDLDQGKLTLPLITLFEQLPPAEAERLRNLWREGNRALRGELQRALRETGAIEMARHRAQSEAEFAVAQLAGLERTAYRECLINLAQWSLRREK